MYLSPNRQIHTKKFLSNQLSNSGSTIICNLSILLSYKDKLLRTIP